ncbi:MAG: hypothetical protein JKX94_02050 [Sneathiella sp.]|nr:hypothetical protein [Sneathiella sp.]
MQYSILIYGAEGVFDRLPQDEQNALMNSHIELQEALKARGKFATAKLMPTQNSVTIKPKMGGGKKPFVIDGPYAETKEQFLGFYVMECDTLEEVIELANKISSPSVTLEIRPIAWVGGVLGEGE